MIRSLDSLAAFAGLRRRRAGRAPLLWVVVIMGLVFSAASARAQCDPAVLCPGAGASCTLSGTKNLGQTCVLDLSTKDVTVLSSGRLNSTGIAPFSLTILANSLNLLGEINSPGGMLTLTITGALTTGSSSVINAVPTGSIATPGVINIVAGTAVFNDDVTANGGGGMRHGGAISVIADTISVRAQMTANGASPGNGGDITLESTSAGAIDVTDDATANGLISANGAGVGAAGGDINVSTDGPITIGGLLRVDGAGGGGGGGINLVGGNTIDVNASLFAEGGGTAAPGGSIFLDADGAMTLNASMEVDGSGGGAGGELQFFGADTITFTTAAALRATGAGNADGGAITARGTRVETRSIWNVNSGATSGNGGSVSIDGDPSGVLITGASQITARGNGGLSGGQIDVSGNGDFTLAGLVDAGAGGAGPGGTIIVATGVQDATQISGSLRTKGGSSGGVISIDGGCDLTLTGTLDSGAITVGYHGSFQATGATMAAIAGQGGNIVRCPCPDADVNGVCDAATCALPPTISGGSINPTVAPQPVVQAPCTGCPNNVIESGPPLNEECDDGNYINTDTCTNNCMSTCGNGSMNPGEQCDEGLANGTPASCCMVTCQFKASGTTCAADTNTCTNDVCNAAGTCTHPNNTLPCDDGNLCTVGDTCSAGNCTGTNNCAKAEMVLLVDVSGSMEWAPNGTMSVPVAEQRLTLAKAAAVPFLDMLEAITRPDASSPALGKFGIAKFPIQPYDPVSCAADTVTSMTPVSTGKATAVSTTIPGLTAVGGTPLLGGLQTADGMFSANTNRAIVLLSDGYHNCPGEVAHTDAAVQSVIAQLEEVGPNDVDVYAVGFGNPADAPLPLLQELATATGGQYRDVTADLGYSPGVAWDAATALQAAFKSVLSDTFGLDAPADPLGEVDGQGLVTDEVRIIDRDRMALVFLSWRTADANRLQLRLRSSDGQLVPDTETGVQATSGDHYKLVALYPEFLQKPGKVGAIPWKVEIDAAGVAAGDSEKYHYSVTVDSKLKMKNGVEPARITTGDVVTLTANLTDMGQPITGLTNVMVNVTRPRDGMGNILFKHTIPADILKRIAARPVGEPRSATAIRSGVLAERGVVLNGRTRARGIRMYDDGTHGDQTAKDGIYTAQFDDTVREGTYAFHFIATGTTTDGITFERENTVERHVSLSLASDRSLVAFTPQQGNTFLVTVTPRDRVGNYLGPDRGAALALHPSKGKLLDRLADDGTGRYTQVLELPDGVDIRDITVDVKPAAPEQPSKPDKECGFTRFFKDLFHCDD